MWNSFGSLFLGLGLLGVPIPYLPTTPFILAATACYLKGSERMSTWMLTNRVFGTYLADYLEGKGVSVRAKMISISMLLIVISASGILATEDDIVRICLVAVAAGVTAHITLLKTKRG